MAQPDSLSQGLAAFMGGLGSQVSNQHNRADAEALQNRQRSNAQMDRIATMKQQEDFQRQNIDRQEHSRKTSEAMGIYNKLASSLGADTEKDPAKSEILYKRAEDVMRQHYAPAYKYLVSSMQNGGKLPIGSPSIVPAKTDLMGGVSKMMFGGGGPMPADSFGTAFPEVGQGFKDYGLVGGAFMAPGGMLGGAIRGTGEIMDNAFNTQTSHPMHPMASQGINPSMVPTPPMMPTPGPQMTPPPMGAPTAMPTATPQMMAPKLMKNPKAKLRKRL